MSSRRRIWTAAAVVGVVALAAPAIADTVSGTDPYPDVVVLARNDVPFDALGVGPVASALGAPVVITSPTALSDSARAAIEDAAPDVVIIAGGEGAISAEVESAVVAVCACTIDRYAGATRDATARLLAAALENYGVQRPVVVGDGGQVVGDVTVGGTLSVDDLQVQQTGRVTNLNADRLDGRQASDFVEYSRTVVVSPVGTPTENGEVLRAAYAAITSATATTPWLVHVEPGTYDLGNTPITTMSWVHLQGSGRDATTLQTSSTALVLSDRTEVRDLSVVADGSSTSAITSDAFNIEFARLSRLSVRATSEFGATAIRLVPGATGQVMIDDVSALASHTDGGAVFSRALYIQGGHVVVTGGSFRTDTTSADTIDVLGGARLEIQGAEVYADGTTTDFAIAAEDDGTLVIAQGLRIGSADGGSIQINDASTARITLHGSTLVDDAARAGTNALCQFNVFENGLAANSACQFVP